jgi:hypothetical protein
MLQRQRGQLYWLGVKPRCQWHASRIPRHLCPEPAKRRRTAHPSGGLLLQGLGGTASAYFWTTVFPESGAATSLAFTTQPGSTTAGSSLPGPPTVAAQDSSGNTVTSFTGSITIAIGNNPGGGSLGGTTTKNAVSGVATFTDLSINQAGNGYTLTASSAGLTGATSAAFNITAGSGPGTIAGTVVRASDGIPINGALVEALQANVVKGSATTGITGSYSIQGLVAGTYTVRASASTYATQTQTGVTVTVGSTTTVNFSLNRVIEIISPAPGNTINDFSVLVEGLVEPPAGIEVGVNVNGFPAGIDMGGFAAVVPVDSQTTSLTATVTDTIGNILGTHTIPVTVQVSEPTLVLQPIPTEGIAPLTVNFTLTSLVPITQISLDLNGDGTVDFQGTTLEGQTFLFEEPGLYYPTVIATDNTGLTRTAVALIQVYDPASFDALLQAKWQGFKNALRVGDIAGALLFIAQAKRNEFQEIFQNLTVPLSAIDQVLTSIQFVQFRGNTAEYETLRTDERGELSYLARFVLDSDGIWRIRDL